MKAYLLFLFCGLLLVAPADALDKWNQAPKPDLVTKVDQAVAKSRSDPVAAERLLREVVTADPSYYRAQLNLGLVLLQAGRFNDSIIELMKAQDMQASLHINDPTIYGELGFAFYQADRDEDAATAFKEGVKHLAEMSPSDQQKLLQRGIAFFLEYQNPAGARSLFEEAKSGLNPQVLPEVQKFLEDGVTRLTKNDVQAGWVHVANHPIGDPSAVQDQLFYRTDGRPTLPVKSDIVTPITTVNMRTAPETPDTTLGGWAGTARVAEQFQVDDVKPVQTANTVSIWMHVKRVKPPHE